MLSSGRGFKTMNLSSENPFIRLFLITVLVLALVRLAGFTVKFGNESLQMDFSAYYTAGEALNHGLSPYKNHITHEPPIWDGVSYFTHGRFLYPPLVGQCFRPLAALPYGVAKHLWNLFSLALLVISITIAFSIIKPELGAESTLLCLIFIALFHPLIAHLERGQVDLVTLALLMGAVKLMPGNNRNKILSGILFSLACLIKLSCGFIAPFLLLRRKWRVLGGFVIGGALILLISLSVNGPTKIGDYLFNQMPRISAFASWGTPKMELPREVFEKHLGEISPPFTLKNGEVYKRASMNFAVNASLSKALFRSAINNRIPAPLSTLSLALCVLFFILMWLWQDRYFKPARSSLSIRGEFLYWQTVMLIILMSGPFTWLMNTVWLLPMIIFVLAYAERPGDRKFAVNLCLCAVALFLIGIPDNQSFSLLTPYKEHLMKSKTVFGEILLLISLLFMLKNFAVAEPAEKATE